jgi:hypothetical protein
MSEPAAHPPDTAPAPPAPRSARGSPRRLAIVGGASVAILVIAYVAFWFAVAGGLRDSVEAWTMARRGEGYAVGYRRLTLGGFPARLVATVEAPSISAPGKPPAWAWRGSTAVARLRPWDLETVTVDLSGDHRLDLVSAGRPLTFAGNAGRLAVIVDLVDGRLRAARLQGADIDLTGEAGPLGAAAIKAAVGLHPEAGTDRLTPSAGLVLAAEGLRLPAAAALPLGERVARLQAEADLMGALRGAFAADALAVWRDEGGTVELRRLETEYGPLTLAAEGTLALDRDMQPIGAFTARIEGFFETIDALRRRHLVRDRDAVTAKLVLGILAKRPPGGGAAVLSLPLTIQERTLFAGPVPLATLPTVAWPAATAE